MTFDEYLAENVKKHGVYHEGDRVVNYKADQFQHRKAGQPGTIHGPEHTNDDGEVGHMVKHSDGSVHFHKTEHLKHQ